MASTSHRTRNTHQRRRRLNMPRAPKKCGHPTCQTRVTARTYCPEHTPVWHGSTRKQRLPPNWATLRTQTETRAHGRCEATRIGRHHHTDCTGFGTDCDHITPGDDHSPQNLCWLSHPCHKAKTADESRTRNRARTRTPATRP